VRGHSPAAKGLGPLTARLFRSVRRRRLSRHPGSMRIFVLPLLRTARVDAFCNPWRVSGLALDPSRPTHVFSRFLFCARGMNVRAGLGGVVGKGYWRQGPRSAGSDIVVEQKLCRPREIRRAERFA
jgi:hypothetical protein